MVIGEWCAAELGTKAQRYRGTKKIEMDFADFARENSPKELDNTKGTGEGRS